MTRRDTKFERVLILTALFFVGLWALAFYMADPDNGFTPLQTMFIMVPTITGTMQHLIFSFIYLDEIF